LTVPMSQLRGEHPVVAIRDAGSVS